MKYCLFVVCINKGPSWPLSPPPPSPETETRNQSFFTRFLAGSTSAFWGAEITALRDSRDAMCFCKDSTFNTDFRNFENALHIASE